MLNDGRLIREIRDASRAMAREWGFMGTTLAGTDYSPSAVHALLEIERGSATTAAQLVQLLGLEKSSVSRMIAKLIAVGELYEAAEETDGRIKRLALTQQGKQTVAAIHTHGESQVAMALTHLTGPEQHDVAKGLSAYANALAKCRTEPMSASESQVTIVEGYLPGLVGRVAEMHAAYYSRHSGFGQFFESQVASGIAEFVGRLERPCNNVWAAVQDGRIVGSIAIDGDDLGTGDAHLRWFILDDGCRGGGVGRQLIEHALAFCDQNGFPATQLWTFKGLDAARSLYERFGFTLTNEVEGKQWGEAVIEQQFSRPTPRSE